MHIYLVKYLHLVTQLLKSNIFSPKTSFLIDLLINSMFTSYTFT